MQKRIEKDTTTTYLLAWKRIDKETDTRNEVKKRQTQLTHVHENNRQRKKKIF